MIRLTGEGLEKQAGIEPTFLIPVGKRVPHSVAPYNRRLPLRRCRLSVLSCVADFRIATVFTLRRSRSFPAVRHKMKRSDSTSGAPNPGWRAEWDSNPQPPGCAAGAHPHVLPARRNGGRTDRPLIQLSAARRKMVRRKTGLWDAAYYATRLRGMINLSGGG